MRKILGVGLVSLLVGTGAITTASAQTAQWTEACTIQGGTIPGTSELFDGTTCMSANLTYASGWFDLSVWNLGGLPGSGSEDEGVIDALGLFGLGLNDSLVTDFEAFDASGNDVTGFWSYGDVQRGAGSLSIFGATCDGKVGSGQDKESCKEIGSGFDDDKETDKYAYTDWDTVDQFNGGGNYLFRLFVGPDFDWLAESVALYAHVKRAVNGESDQYFCYADTYSGDTNPCVPPCEPGTPDCDDPGGPQEVVPEPATMTLLATGLVGMAAARRRKKKNS